VTRLSRPAWQGWRATKCHRNGLTSDDAKYASPMSAAAIKTKVNTLLLIREPCCGV
jgi:hypothetical protein